MVAASTQYYCRVCSFLHNSSLHLQAPFGNTPDVWIQLLREFLCAPSCRQALFNRSTGTAAAPAELMLAKLAAALAEELAAAGPAPELPESRPAVTTFHLYEEDGESRIRQIRRLRQQPDEEGSSQDE
jgi:hypothetical protein